MSMSISDSYGHVVGNAFIRVVVQCLRPAVRDDNVVGRLGDDEFVVLLPRVRDSNAAAFFVRKM